MPYYDGRLETPDGTPTADATYLEVILRPWGKAVAWAGAKHAQGRWREVHAHNLDHIMSWLRDAPMTHAWLTAVLGHPSVRLPVSRAMVAPPERGHHPSPSPPSS